MAGLIAVTAIAGSIFYVLDNQNRKSFRQIDLPANSDNHVKIREDVYVADEPSDIQKNYKEVMIHDSQYTIVYKKELPEFFTKMQIGDVFLVYPDSSATESFFALGFCGRLAKVNESRDKSSVSFTIPELANVFSDIYINTEDTSNTSSVSANFYPSPNVTEIQCSRSGSGKLSLDYTLKESGFVQMEVNGNGKNTYLIKGYDYPNPVKESRKPTNEENSSVPSVHSESSGQANFDLVVGADIGMCILGMIPVKQTNNLVELEIAKTFSEEQTKDKTAEVLCNTYLLDDTVNNLILSTSSHIKMHFGARIDFGLLKYTVAEMGGSIQLFKHVWYQFPSPIGFSHSQCGFGGVFVGEIYSDQELDKAFRDYMNDTNRGSIFGTLKDSLLSPLVNAALNDLPIDFIDISAYLGGHAENYKFNYYSSGIIYVRDLNNMVVAAVVSGEDIANMSGVHTGLNSAKLEQVYSAPDQEAKIDIHIGSLARSLLGIKGIEDTSLAGMSYDSADSDEEMNLVFCDDFLHMILVTRK